MENNNNPYQPQEQPVNTAPDGFFFNVGGSDVVVQKSRAPIVLTLICMFLAGAVAAGLLFFLSGAASSYEQAERNSFNALAGDFSSVVNFSDVFSGSGSISITPSREISTFVPGLPDLGSIILNYEAIMEGGDIYALLGMDALGIQASLSLWQLGEEMFMHFPGISEYYIAFGNMLGMSEAMGMTAQLSDFDEAEVMAELAVIGSAILDRYFQLTENVQSRGKETVIVGDLSRTADVYEIIMDEIFLLELVVTALDAFLDSEELMRLCEAYYELYMESYYWWGVQVPSFKHEVEDLYFDAFDELDYLYDFGTNEDEFITMRVFVSGKEVVRRDIIIEDVTFSYSSIKDKSDFATNVRLTADDTTITYRNDGKINGGYSTGRIRFSITYAEGSWSARYNDPVSLTVNYENFKTYDNGLFGGDIRVSVPVQDGLNVDISFNSKVSGDSMNAGGSLSVFGMKILDLEITSSINTGKSIPRPNMSKVLDADDWRAMEAFEEDFMMWALGLGVDLDFIEDLIYDLIWANSTSNSWDWEDDWAWDGEWNDGWDGYCYECWDFHEEWEDCYNYDWGGYDFCEDCGYWHWGDEDCHIPCEKCGNIKWSVMDDETRRFYLGYYGGYWKALLGSDWNQSVWDALLREWEDCFASFWFDDFVEIFAGYGINVAVQHDAANYAFYGIWDYVDATGDWDYYYWSIEQWEEAWRVTLENAGISF
jgi:hypothetical protein